MEIIQFGKKGSTEQNFPVRGIWEFPRIRRLLLTTRRVRNCLQSNMFMRMFGSMFENPQGACSKQSSMLDSLFMHCSVFGSTNTDISEWSALLLP